MPTDVGARLGLAVVGAPGMSIAVGTAVGGTVGAEVGDDTGARVAVGGDVGNADGAAVGAALGVREGAAEGALVGAADGWCITSHRRAVACCRLARNCSSEASATTYRLWSALKPHAGATSCPREEGHHTWPIRTTVQRGSSCRDTLSPILSCKRKRGVVPVKRRTQLRDGTRRGQGWPPHHQ